MRKILILLFLACYYQSFACECRIYPYKDGKVPTELHLEDGFKTATVIIYSKYLGQGRFKVIKFYRGSEIFYDKKLIIKNSEPTLCGYGFKKDKNYLVFGLWMKIKN